MIACAAIAPQSADAWIPITDTTCECGQLLDENGYCNTCDDLDPLKRETGELRLQKLFRPVTTTTSRPDDHSAMKPVPNRSGRRRAKRTRQA